MLKVSGPDQISVSPRVPVFVGRVIVRRDFFLLSVNVLFIDEFLRPACIQCLVWEHLTSVFLV
jgi:hypothetical protein